MEENKEYVEVFVEIFDKYGKNRQNIMLFSWETLEKLVNALPNVLHPGDMLRVTCTDYDDDDNPIHTFTKCFGAPTTSTTSTSK